ncbi:putative N-acetylated-alpha-linked acidic dipeptidase [Clytia hemisphaerica]
MKLNLENLIQKRRWAVIATCIAISSFFIGFVFDRHLTENDGFLSIFRRNFDYCDRSWHDVNEEYSTAHDAALKKIDVHEIDKVFKYLVEKPHLGGSIRNNELGDYMADKWESYGMKVYKKTYQVLLSVPKKPAVLQLFHLNGSVDYEPEMIEHAFYKEENHTDRVPPFHAFSAAGDVMAELMHVNYGNQKDYEDIFERNLDVQGKIVMAKLDKNWRGEKVRLAELYGAVGVLFYTDPRDGGRNPGTKGYPDDWALPEHAMRRGGLLNLKGDPLTPGWPSTEGMFRMNESSIEGLPQIPVQPISDHIAKELLSKFKGVEAPNHWHTSFTDITNRIQSHRVVRLQVNTENVFKNITNVFGVLEGDTESDRLVIMGNHRDAWVYGAGDPSSGTACMMEVSRVLGQITNDVPGWAPRRTIIFASWDAEEYGLAGSWEWLEEYATMMQANTVVYLNVDIGVSGNHSIRAHATPSLSKSLFESAKQLKDPENDDTTKNTGVKFSNLYERWNAKLPSDDFPNEPLVSMLTSGSDYSGFYMFYGIPAVDIRYEFDRTASENEAFDNYPAYHTIYDNENYVKKFLDPDMKYHKTVAEMLLLQLLKFSDDLLLPFDLSRYALKIKTDWDIFKREFVEILTNNTVSIDHLDFTIEQLLNTTLMFHHEAKKLSKQDLNQVRRYNDQLMWFERSFVVPEGLKKDPAMRHSIFNSGSRSLFSRNTFPSLSRTLYNIFIEKTDAWDDLRKEISILDNRLQNAILVLSEYGF